MPTNELWKTTYVWLNSAGYKLNRSYCKEEITTHPDYPALISVIDLLDKIGMSYEALRSDPSYINEFNYPLLAHIKEPGNEHMHLILDPSGWDKMKEITRYWTGIVLYTKMNAVWQQEGNLAFKKAENKRNANLLCFLILGLGFYLASMFELSNILINIFGFFSFVGIIISLIAMTVELGIDNQIAKQVCGAVGKRGCDQVISSHFAVGFAGTSLADISVYYFTTQFIVYLIGCWHSELFQSIYLLSYAGPAIAFWSFYMQGWKVKQWCTICLCISGILISQSVISFAAAFVLTGIFPELVFLAIFLIIVMVIVPIKQLIKINYSNKIKLIELKRWLLDADLFIDQLELSQQVDTSFWENDVLLGNPRSSFIITMVCNPYCGPCARAHKKIDALLKQFPGKICVQIRFLFISPSENNKLAVATKSILQKAVSLQNNNDQLQEMLSDWFEWMDYDKWCIKWMPDKTIDVNHRMNQHFRWIEENSIVFTPTFFINGRKIPGRYSLENIPNLIPQLTKIFDKEFTI